MRCRKAGKKLSEMIPAGVSLDRDKKLMEHLSHCPACAARAEAIAALHADLEAARGRDDENSMSWAELKQNVEKAAAARIDRREKEKSIMTEIIDKARSRPKFSVGMAVFAVIIILSLVIPFKYDKTIGYEVALAGVDKDLALDGEKINLLLEKLGVGDAVVDIGDCDSTCKVYIKRLKTSDDANLVIAAFSEIDNVELLDDVKPVNISTSGNIIKIAADEILLDRSDGKTTDELRHIIIEKLGVDCDLNNMIWMTDSVEGEGSVALNVAIGTCDSTGGIATMMMDVEGGVISAFTHKLGESGDLLWVDSESGPINIDSLCAAEKIICLPADGEIDDSTRKKMEAMGVRVIVKSAEDCINDDDDLIYDTDDDADNPDLLTARESSLVPDKFGLAQNYPNPFNPTTIIDYSLPQSQHVKLEIVNINGQLVRTLVDEHQESGIHSVEWDATDTDGNEVAAGVYLYRITAGEFSETKKMSFVK